jgi:hypothetical protein
MFNSKVRKSGRSYKDLPFLKYFSDISQVRQEKDTVSTEDAGHGVWDLPDYVKDNTAMESGK